jgi:tRNA pseudouridine32 synthase / 23S rRNA pseudouridine746 synthase
MATSGLLLMARGTDVQRALSRAFEARQVHKRYQAIVQGHPAQDQGEIDLPLMSDWPRRPRQMVSPEGRPSLTRWQVLQRFADTQGRPCTRLLLEPVTGRSHQLRVHLQFIGHAILGDPLYADDAEAAMPRLLLHACELGLTHPVDGRERQWHSVVPF